MPRGPSSSRRQGLQRHHVGRPDHAPGANAGKFTGRSGTTTEASDRGEHSYLKHPAPASARRPRRLRLSAPIYVLPDAINTAACPGDHIIDNEPECELFHAWAAEQPAGYLQGALEPFVSYPDGLHPTTGNVMAGYGFGCHLQDWPAPASGSSGLASTTSARHVVSIQCRVQKPLVPGAHRRRLICARGGYQREIGALAAASVDVRHYLQQPADATATRT